MTIRWSPTAVADLTHLRSFTAAHDSAAAARVAHGILEAVEKLETWPALGRPGRLPHTRELVIPGTPFVVPYTVAGDGIRIIAVIHSARSWPEASES